MQRLQVGLFGLGAMVLLVGLASIVTNARQDQAGTAPETAASVAVAPSPAAANDPLADAGVVPDMPGEPAPEPAPRPPAPGR